MLMGQIVNNDVSMNPPNETYSCHILSKFSSDVVIARSETLMLMRQKCQQAFPYRTLHARKAVRRFKFKMAATCSARSVGNSKTTGSKVKLATSKSKKSPELLLDGPAISEHISVLVPFKFPLRGKTTPYRICLCSNFQRTTPPPKMGSFFTEGCPIHAHCNDPLKAYSVRLIRTDR